MLIPRYNPNQKERIIKAIADQESPTHFIVIDLESRAKCKNAAVFNIAGILASFDAGLHTDFDKLGVPDHFDYRLDMVKQFSLGRVEDKDTVEFWNAPERAEALAHITKMPLIDFVEGMKLVHAWITEIKSKVKCRVFYRGMDFDGPILESLFKDAGIENVWKRGDAARDIRSYLDAKLDGFTGYVPGEDRESTEYVAHTALADCLLDVRRIQFAYTYSRDGAVAEQVFKEEIMGDHRGFDVINCHKLSVDCLTLHDIERWIVESNLCAVLDYLNIGIKWRILDVNSHHLSTPDDFPEHHSTAGNDVLCSIRLNKDDKINHFTIGYGAGSVIENFGIAFYLRTNLKRPD